MEQSGRTPGDAAASPPTGRGKGRWFRFSLCTLVIFVLLVGSGMGLWWKWEPWVLARVLVGDMKLMSTMYFSPDGRSLIVAGNPMISDRTVKAWDLGTSRQLFELPDVYELAWMPFSPNGDFLVTVNADFRVAIRDGKSGATLRFIDTLPQRIFWAVLSPDGRTIATSSDEDAVRLWDTASARCLWSVPARNGRAFFSPDSRLAVVSHVEESAVIFGARSGTRLAAVDAGGDPLAAMFSPDGTHVLTGHMGHMGIDLHVWNIADGKRQFALSAQGTSLTFPSCSPDDRLLLTAETGGIVRTWDATTGALCATVHANDTSSDSALCFSPDSRRILVAFHLSSAKLWDARDGRQLFIFKEGAIAVCAAFSPDGNRIAIGREGGPVEIWEKRRDESPYGILAIPEFWLTVVFAAAFVWSVWRDRLA